MFYIYVTCSTKQKAVILIVMGYCTGLDCTTTVEWSMIAQVTLSQFSCSWVLPTHLCPVYYWETIEAFKFWRYYYAKRLVTLTLEVNITKQWFLNSRIDTVLKAWFVPMFTRQLDVRKPGQVVPMFTAIRRQKAWSCCPNVYAAVRRQKAWSCCPNVYTAVRRRLRFQIEDDLIFERENKNWVVIQ